MPLPLLPCARAQREGLPDWQDHHVGGQVATQFPANGTVAESPYRSVFTVASPQAASGIVTVNPGTHPESPLGAQPYPPKFPDTTSRVNG